MGYKKPLFSEYVENGHIFYAAVFLGVYADSLLLSTKVEELSLRFEERENKTKTKLWR